MAEFGGFGVGLEFGSPYLSFFLEGHEVFLDLSSEVIDVLLGPVEHKSSVDVAVSGDWGAICVPLAEVYSI